MSKSVLLIIGGGIAAYKSLELIRTLKKVGIGTRVIMTKASEHFVTPLSVASLSGEKVFTDLFSLTDETEMGHIELSRSTDLVVVAPATADLMAKMAQGLANDLASTALLATDKPVLLAPAMNVRMWHHAATQRNIETLTKDGIHFVGPNPGEMACGEFGLGRMAEPAEIAAAIEKLLYSDARPLSGKHVLITAGPTREPIDPVRFISNHSSGKQGYALAEQAERMGAKVTLVSGPVSLPTPPGVTKVDVETADQMLAACEAVHAPDLVICAAAVADWKVANPATQKLKKNDKAEAPALSFAANPDILKTLSNLKSGRAKLVVGFAAETVNVIANAQEKLKRKGCDLIIANNVSEGVFGADKNAVHVISKDGVENWPQASKVDVARRILELCAGRLK
ncbi:bifunctional phosphopantothenoylcysteine decarboxylase/phosphopantothenate--cysteine ligase CoaBC [Aestuariivirga litoralis]|uniref:bifunctional phosphopantothenoylcysteine decarboxylase/phosphopantothenate--cysteine ligase CoaBC n=1 Tax=Aestuariivirga litoralis TaxID=2650924 RepID=UPI0018C5750E|nr:bifunctional phosphopantothenoylcysteine decarboxylase/phosphopantothenate--cysteine ligase CoaBC [Aestuariivirga litoralis]MBG1233840.1 bifunctional phosphopantothenoylcysteine decarboxylase/phosphopantothenate--cysteine ligase CoaBC [Aestuariivirga litoralis]